MDIVVDEDDIADVLRTWLPTFQYWTAYMDKKAHMGGEVRLAMTDTMARFIASESYADIIK